MQSVSIITNIVTRSPTWRDALSITFQRITTGGTFSPRTFHSHTMKAVA